MQNMPASETAALKQVAKDTPEAWVAIGMAVQWLVEQFGSDYGISYDTVMSWVAAISEATRATDGGGMTVAAALVFAAGRLGYKYSSGRKQ